ncbi:NAD(P)-binding protein [Lindgomyces ingoldianus]|uniref:NAD(P)-binding protein n=1 Tax=Lindgomyces ingoldianus TaxID=673940 RepID=A0ACB6QHF8_9PLEO|nr:NAD(P)-binding protein [Lindgomyces ingoldianus]KAF2465940.1 NAD(P)-binding protein [Lindgomyces ingoldianus]
MPFPYKHVLLIGATSGIGKAMADRFIDEGVKVTAVGRRQERLDDFVSSHGSDKASSFAFDIGDLDKIPTFVEITMKTYPSIDCVFLNAGTHHRFDFSKPDSVDLEVFNREITVNFTSFVALAHALLPPLLASNEHSSLIFTGTPISLVPAFILPAYSASKAALDAFIMCLREQLRDTNVRVMHISPGPIQTELHDSEMGQESGRSFGMPLKDFVDQAYAGLNEGRADIFPGCVGGSTKEQFMEIVEKRGGGFARLSKLLRGIY